MEKKSLLESFSPAEQFIYQKLKKEVSASLYYHGVHHTLDVLEAALKIAEAEKITKEELRLLRIGALYHDAGFITIYKNHEERGCEMAHEFLPSFGFTTPEIKVICKMIMATKLPQNAHSKLEKIICDADLDYLGREDFYQTAETLFSELKKHSYVKDKEEWNEIQKSFLQKHTYYTSYSRENREPQKQIFLKEISGNNKS
ncbi:MAG: HD domain-containing protein [Ginsengibacter sp.]